MKATVFDTAHYILSKMGEISALKLQKLVYYSQAWSLVWDDDTLFDSDFEAWVGGPVCVELYERHKGQFKVNKDQINGNIKNLAAHNTETINIVLDYYGNKNGQWLSDLTHMEEPWLEARKGLKSNERGNKKISLETMQQYYSSL